MEKDGRAFYEKEGRNSRRYDSSSYWDSRYHLRRKKRIVEILNSCQHIETFLDVGCGTGEYIVEAAKISDSPIGLDLSSAYLRRIKRKHENAILIQADARTLPFKNKSIDCILCSETLEHLPQAEIAIQEIARVARKNLIISTPNYGLLRVTLRIFSQQSLRKLDKSVGHVRVLSLSQLHEETLKNKYRIKFEKTLHITPPIIGESLHLPRRMSALLDVLERIFDKILPKLGNVTLLKAEAIANERLSVQTLTL
jgi:ubiquinone/menaquinone biosynthesis C-methylase UbiE